MIKINFDLASSLYTCKMGNKSSTANKPGEITSQDRAILDLKVQRDKLKQYQKKVINLAEQIAFYTILIY